MNISPDDEFLYDDHCAKIRYLSWKGGSIRGGFADGKSLDNPARK